MCLCHLQRVHDHALQLIIVVDIPVHIAATSALVCNLLATSALAEPHHYLLRVIAGHFWLAIWLSLWWCLLPYLCDYGGREQPEVCF